MPPAKRVLVSIKATNAVERDLFITGVGLVRAFEFRRIIEKFHGIVRGKNTIVALIYCESLNWRDIQPGMQVPVQFFD